MIALDILSDEEQETMPMRDDEKLTILRQLAAEGFEAIDRGEAVTLAGDEQLTDFLAKVGRRAAQKAARGRGRR